MKKETKKAPTIRFRGFTDDWEQRKLGDICGVYDGVHQTPDYQEDGVMFLSVENIATLTSEKYISEDAYNRNYKVYPEKGDILMTRIGDVGTPHVVETNEKLAYYVSLALLKPKGIDSYFLNNAIQAAPFQKGLLERTLLTAIPMKINKDEIGKVDISFPVNISEQKQIGSYFRNLDNLVTLHQRKLDQLKTLKKYFLQNMFPAKGEKVPRIRFKGFTGDWEQRKLEDLASFSKGSGYSKSDLQASGTPIVLYGRLYTKYETVIKDIDTFVDALADSVYSQGGEVIVPASGETAEDISIASVVEKPGIVLGGDLNIIHPTDDLDSTFLAISISHGNPHKEMAKRAQGKSVVHLHNNDLAQIKLWYPSVTEQRKISQYFSGLDTLITLHQRKLDQLQTMKKFMLQNLFI